MSKHKVLVYAASLMACAVLPCTRNYLQQYRCRVDCMAARPIAERRGSLTGRCAASEAQGHPETEDNMDATPRSSWGIPVAIALIGVFAMMHPPVSEGLQIIRGNDVKVTLDNHNIDAGFATPSFDGRNMQQNETSVAVSPVATLLRSDPTTYACLTSSLRFQPPPTSSVSTSPSMQVRPGSIRKFPDFPLTRRQPGWPRRSRACRARRIRPCASTRRETSTSRPSPLSP